MPKPISAAEMLNREFLEIRCRLLDIAASLDRIDRRSQGAAIHVDARHEQLCEALRMLSAGGSDRAERMQMIFSDPYQGGWKHAK